MHHLPLVTIIAICHNHHHYVVETLDSIRNQIYPNIQCIIINNLKDDGCQEVIENWLEKHKYDALFIQNDSPLSLPKNLNLGLLHTKGEYFQGISCDDIFCSTKIQKQVAYFEQLNDSFACIYSDMTLIDKDGTSLDRSYFTRFGIDDFDRIQNDDNLKSELSYRCIIPAPTILLRTKIIISLGCYDESYDAEDWPLYHKLLRFGFGFRGIDECLVKRRVLSNSLGNTKSLKRLKSLSLVFKNNMDLFKNITIVRQKWIGVAFRIGEFSWLEAMRFMFTVILWSRGKAILDIPRTFLRLRLLNKKQTRYN